MKVIIENIIASCKLEGDLDLPTLANGLKGSSFKPESFNGVMYHTDSPSTDFFILNDRTLKVHGLSVMDSIDKAINSLISSTPFANQHIRRASPTAVEEVIASLDLEEKLDAKGLYEEFKPDGVIYDPSELPGFILNMGRSGIEVLIFPEGKLVTKGAKSIHDAVSSLQMVEARIRKMR